MNNSLYLLPYANLDWVDADTAYAPRFDDIYWSRSSRGGLQEKQHVFIDGNDLAPRWRQLNKGDQFTILETGFGFGLNFSLAIKLWQSLTCCQEATLHYLAFEQYPVSPTDLKRLNAVFDNTLLQPLLENYPLPVPGSHHLWINANICLTLVFGDINETLPTISAKVDALFLDGFSPAKNKQMWTASLLDRIAATLRPGATVSTYSVASNVRRGLMRAGLRIEKVGGFGSKAEMIKGKKSPSWAARNTRGDPVCIIGAGLAGIYCALALKRRGINYVLYEAEAEPLGAVKKIDHLGLYPQLSAKPQSSSLFSLRAFEYFRRHFNYHASGRLQLFRHARDRARAGALTELFPPDILSEITADEATGLAAVPLAQDGLYFPAAGWINPREICGLADLSAVYGISIDQLEQDDSEWLLFHKNREIHRTRLLILATGAAPQGYLAPLALTPVRGQCLSILATPSPALIISGDVSWFPENHGRNTVSATFSRDDPEGDIRQGDSAGLIRDLQNLSPVNVANHKASVGFRSTTRDRMPVAGPVPNWKALARYCHLPARERQGVFDQYEPGLYCAVGFGSHGLTHAPLCGEYLVRLINHEPVARLPELSASRFALRDAGIRN